MPTYLYEDTRTGETVELFRHIDERYDVPRNLKLIIARGHGGVDKKSTDDRDPDAAVPRAFKQLSNNEVNKFVKESGFSVDHVKRVWQMAVIIMAFLCHSYGQDLTQGYIFQPNQQNINSTELNAIVGSAVINPEFYTTKSAAAPAAADTLLFYSSSASGYRKATVSTMFLANTALITGQSEDTALATNDFVLTYDTSAATFKKAALDTLWRKGIAIYPRIGWTNLVQSALLSVQQGGTNANIAISDFQRLAITNLAPVANTETLSGEDFTVIETGQTNATRKVQLWRLQGNFTNLVVDSGTYFTGVKLDHSMGTVGATELANLVATNRLPRFVSFDYALAAGSVANTNHGLAGTPQLSIWVLVCTVNDNGGWVIGDEVPVAQFHNAGGTNVFTGGASSTNVWLSWSGQTIRGYNKTNGASTALTTVRWSARNYSTYQNY